MISVLSRLYRVEFYIDSSSSFQNSADHKKEGSNLKRYGFLTGFAAIAVIAFTLFSYNAAMAT